MSDVLKPARSDTRIATEDSEDVYFRFGGAAIAAMLQVRYKMKGSTCTNQDQVYFNFAEVEYLR